MFIAEVARREEYGEPRDRGTMLLWAAEEAAELSLTVPKYNNFKASSGWITRLERRIELSARRSNSCNSLGRRAKGLVDR